jgi:hypothetical protein
LRATTSAQPIPNFYNRDSGSTWKPFGCWIDSPVKTTGSELHTWHSDGCSTSRGVTSTLWGARHPGQLDPIDEAMGWRLDAKALLEVNRIVRNTVKDPVGPEFMAPPTRERSQLDMKPSEKPENGLKSGAPAGRKHI